MLVHISWRFSEKSTDPVVTDKLRDTPLAVEATVGEVQESTMMQPVIERGGDADRHATSTHPPAEDGRR